MKSENKCLINTLTTRILSDPEKCEIIEEIGKLPFIKPHIKYKLVQSVTRCIRESIEFGINSSNREFVFELLKFTGEYDLTGELFWNRNLDFYVVCNDFFYYASADAEEITKENFSDFKQAIEDAGDVDGTYLFCARIRKLRPLPEAYQWLSPDNIEKFNACGPPRDFSKK